MSITKPDGYVYRITNNINGKTYIGSHAGHNPKYMGSGVALKRAYDKYGSDNFTKEIVLHCEEFQEVEEQILMVLNAANDPQMYNLTNNAKGTLGMKHSAEALAKMSAAHSGHLNPQYGKTPTAETRAKISASQIGKTLTAEHRAKISTANTGKTPTAETRAKISASQTGKTLTAEHRAKIGSSQIGKTLTEETRAKISSSQIGKTLTEETRAKISNALGGVPQPKVACPYCLKTGGVSIMKRWHFDNCKHKPNSL